MLRWFFDAKDASPLEILSVVSPETFSRTNREPRQGSNRPYRTDTLTSTTANDAEMSEAVLRWRRVVLNLSEEFSHAANTHPHLAPVFMEAMGNLLEQLLLFGREADVIALDEWLSFRPASE